MAFSFSQLTARIPAFLKTKWAIGALAVAVLGGGYWLLHSGKAPPQTIAVTRGSITETVSVTGNTTPTQSVSLGFGAGGTVAAVYSSIGNRVSSGAVLAELNTADVRAQLKGAQADLDTQKAKLAGLTAGSRPEDIASAQAAADKSAQDLENLYSGVSDIASDSFAKANDAVRTELSALFSNGETPAPQLSFSTADSQSATDAKSARVAASTALNQWQAELPTLVGAAPAALDAAIQKDVSRLSSIHALLDDVTAAVNGATNLDPATLASYKASAASALTEVNAAIKNLNAASQGIASQKLTVAQLAAQLNLAKAGSTAEDIAAQSAQVKAAEANVESIEAKLQNSVIVAPLSGTITQFDAKAGQTASAGAALVSIISSGSFEVDADVPEIDIGKISVGDAVSMTLDAFSGETFKGKVFYIDPAETVTQGVVNYKVKVSFDTADARMKSGLTVNLGIETRHKDDVLILPQYAILQNDAGTFVEILKNGVATDTPVTLGIQDAAGNVEVTNGVTEGEQVLNIGLKQQ